MIHLVQPETALAVAYVLLIILLYEVMMLAATVGPIIDHHDNQQ